MIRKLLNAFLLSLPLTGVALAGWSSGGGNLIGDTNNPWFLQNTKSVNYQICMGSYFSASTDHVDKLIRKALKWWRADLQKASRVVNPGYAGASKPLSFEVGTQDWRLIPCQFESKNGQQADVTFYLNLMGPEMLRDGALRMPVDELRKTIAFTELTHYDRTHLKGKGYIWINGDVTHSRNLFNWSKSGVHPSEDVVENAWQYEGILFAVLVHEIGHVLGLRHVHAPADLSVMGEGFLENTLMKEHLQAHTGTEWLPSFFEKNLATESQKQVIGLQTDRLKAIQKYFGVANADQWFATEFLGSTWNVYSSGNLAEVDQFEKCAAGVINSRGYSSFGDPVISLSLTPQQQVFRDENGRAPSTRILYGYGRKVEWVSGFLTNKKNEKRYFRLKASSSSTQGKTAEGILDDELIFLP